jgi:hypothetical protein
MIEFEAKRGTEWADDELDAIIEVYFLMLSQEIAGKPYVKARHGEELMSRLQRTHRSVEFKNQNISAVLEKLGLPWIAGYKPKRNYQKAIIDAVDRYLSKHDTALSFPVPQREVTDKDGTSEVFVPHPNLSSLEEATPGRLRRLIAKFDPGRRDQLNRSLGRAGEEFTVEVERRRLADAGRRDLADKIRWTANEDGDGAGYDISSFNVEGSHRFIEVKTTNGSARTPFFITRNELSAATELSENWLIYRVHQFATQPKIFTMAPPLDTYARLTPQTWSVSF